MTKLLTLCCALALVLNTTGCNRQEAETSQPADTQAQHTEATTAAGQEAATPTATAIKKGTVAESINAAGYTYILVDDGQAKQWVAVMETPVQVGEEISYYDGMVMENLVSKALNRTFERVIFSNGLVGQAPVSPSAMMAGHSADAVEQADSFTDALKAETGMGAQALPTGTMGSSKARVAFADIKVDKATGENSYTVGEIFAQATELNGKKVTIRGKVMKVSPRIMGLNWIHLQDGTGDPAKTTHDLVATTTAEPQDDWDVITVSGVLAANKDFGAGYLYDAILEEAVISK